MLSLVEPRREPRRHAGTQILRHAGTQARSAETRARGAFFPAESPRAVWESGAGSLPCATGPAGCYVGPAVALL